MSQNPFDILKNSRPSQARIQDDRRRMNQGPAIHDAKTVADEAHSRITNTAVDAAHTAAENAYIRGDAAHFRASNTSLDNAHIKAENANGNADSRLSRANGGTVVGVSKFTAFLEEDTIPNTLIDASTQINFTVVERVKHLAMAHVKDGTNGFIPLPTVGSNPVFIKKNVAEATFGFGIINTRTVQETIHARVWSEAY